MFLAATGKACLTGNLKENQLVLSDFSRGPDTLSIIICVFSFLNLKLWFTAEVRKMLATHSIFFALQNPSSKGRPLDWRPLSSLHAPLCLLFSVTLDLHAVPRRNLEKLRNTWGPETFAHSCPGPPSAGSSRVSAVSPVQTALWALEILSRRPDSLRWIWSGVASRKLIWLFSF